MPRSLTGVLRVRVLDCADGGDAHSVEIRACFGGVTLKITMQGAIALRDGQFVILFGEVVHADIEIAGFEEVEKTVAENVELSHAFGKKANEGALLLFQPGYVSVAEHGDAVGG
jgi:hypothetical protein